MAEKHPTRRTGGSSLMWPWEHAAFGYLLFSASVHAWRRTGPEGPAVLVLLLATQLPDLVDKPLSWQFGLFPSGFSIAHSLFVAVPLIVLAVVAARRRARGEFGVGFGVGYGSHLVGDVLDPVRTGDAPDLGRVLWPVVTQSPYEHDYGFLGRAVRYLRDLVETVAVTDASSVVVLYVALPLGAVVLWLVDGAPGVATARAVLDGRADRE